MSENPIIDAKRAEIAQIDAQITELQAKRDIAHAMLEGMMMMVSEMDNDTPKEERRMRLGSKKRVTYNLVASGFETLKELNLAVTGYDIDSRYIRDVVRKAVHCGDMLGDIDDRFILSDAGKEILSKAPKPKDWTPEYEALSQRTPTRGVAIQTDHAMPGLSPVATTTPERTVERQKLEQEQEREWERNQQFPHSHKGW